MNFTIHIGSKKPLVETEKEIQNLLRDTDNIAFHYIEEESENPKEFIHLWDGHGRAKCGETCWGKFPSLDVVKTIKLTLYDKNITCRKCKNILRSKESTKILKS